MLNLWDFRLVEGIESGFGMIVGMGIPLLRRLFLCCSIVLPIEMQLSIPFSFIGPRGWNGM
jgi:hypothetical protein